MPKQLTSFELELQINALEKILRGTPEKTGTKYNPRHFSLKNKIIGLKKQLADRKQFEFNAH